MGLDLENGGPRAMAILTTRGKLVHAIVAGQGMKGFLGSRLIDQSQKMTAAAMQMAEKKVWAHRS